MGTNQNQVCNFSSKDEVFRINVLIKEDNIIHGAKEILRVVRPDWIIENVTFKVCFVR